MSLDTVDEVDPVLSVARSGDYGARLLGDGRQGDQTHRNGNYLEKTHLIPSGGNPLSWATDICPSGLDPRIYGKPEVSKSKGSTMKKVNTSKGGRLDDRLSHDRYLPGARGPRQKPASSASDRSYLPACPIRRMAHAATITATGAAPNVTARLAAMGSWWKRSRT